MILTLVHVCSSTVIYGVIDFNFELFFFLKPIFILYTYLIFLN